MSDVNREATPAQKLPEQARHPGDSAQQAIRQMEANNMQTMPDLAEAKDRSDRLGKRVPD